MDLKTEDIVAAFESDEYAKKAAELIKIDQTNLEYEFAEQAKRYAYFAVQTANAKRKYALLENEIETLYAVVETEKRFAAQQTMAENPKIKYTEQMYKNEARTDQRYQIRYKELISAGHMVDVLHAISISFTHRKDMLMQLGASDRIGLRDPRIMEEANVERHRAKKTHVSNE